MDCILERLNLISIIEDTIATSRPPRKAIVRRIEVIKKATSWNNLTDVVSIKAFLNGSKNLKGQDAIIEKKKIIKTFQEDVAKFSNKKRLLRIRESIRYWKFY